MRGLILCALLVFLVCATGVNAVSPFQNLDFQSANLSEIPAGQFGGNVPITNALPFWTGYLGTNRVTQALHNSITLGNVSIDILGPNWDASPLILGQYTVMLQSGGNPFGGGAANAAIAQVGLVPVNTQSILLDVIGTNFSLSFSGQIIPLSTVGSGLNYTVYGGNVSVFAGQVGELRVSTFNPDGTAIELGPITFSTQAIPEQSSVSLLLGGVLGLFFWQRTRHKPAQ